MSFSKATFQEIAPYAWLDPLAGGQDILHLDTFRSRNPTSEFQEICEDVDKATRLYGPIHTHDDEEARSRFIASVSIINNNYFMNRGLNFELTWSLVFHYHWFAFRGLCNQQARRFHTRWPDCASLSCFGCNVVFIEVERTLAMGKQRLDTKAQVLTECAGT